MVGRSCLALVALCGCAQLGPTAGWEPRPALVSSLAGWNGGYGEEVGGWDVRVGLVLPYEYGTLSVGPRFDAGWVKYFKAETFSIELGAGVYLMHNSREDSGGWIYVVPATCMGKYFFELIYRSGFKVYVGAGLTLYWAGVIGEPDIEINDLAFNVPFCFGVQLSREERPTIEIEIKFDSPVYELGFKRIPMEHIGLYEDEYRRSLNTE